MLPLLCQGPESFLPETPELLRALLDVHSRLRDKRFSGYQLGLSGAVERQQLPQQLLLLRLAAAAAWRVDQRQPSGGEHFFVKSFSFDWRPGARRPGELDEDAIAGLQLGVGLGLFGA